MIIGIDPGQYGAISCLWYESESNRWLVDVWDMPTIDISKTRKEIDTVALFELLSGIKSSKIYVEKVGPVAGASRASTFTFGRNYEAVISAVKMIKVPYDLVDSKVWKAEVLKNTDKSKQAAITWCTRNFPECVIADKDGRADAICIAEYGRRLHE